MRAATQTIGMITKIGASVWVVVVVAVVVEPGRLGSGLAKEEEVGWMLLFMTVPGGRPVVVVDWGWGMGRGAMGGFWGGAVFGLSVGDVKRPCGGRGYRSDGGKRGG